MPVKFFQVEIETTTGVNKYQCVCHGDESEAIRLVRKEFQISDAKSQKATRVDRVFHSEEMPIVIDPSTGGPDVEVTVAEGPAYEDSSLSEAFKAGMMAGTRELMEQDGQFEKPKLVQLRLHNLRNLDETTFIGQTTVDSIDNLDSWMRSHLDAISIPDGWLPLLTDETGKYFKDESDIKQDTHELSEAFRAAADIEAETPITIGGSEAQGEQRILDPILGITPAPNQPESPQDATGDGSMSIADWERKHNQEQISKDVSDQP